jgi:hypothetical protein
MQALAGFSYSGPGKTVEIAPRWKSPRFASIWAAGSSWGMLRQAAAARQLYAIEVRGGDLVIRRIVLPGVSAAAAAVRINGSPAAAKSSRNAGLVVELDQEIRLRKGDKLELNPG